MAHICQVHPYEVAEGLCRSCGGPFCADCLVYPFGPVKPPYCVPCAVSAAGVRQTARNPTVVVPKETKRRLKEWRQARKRDLQSPPPDGVATWQKMDEAAVADEEDHAAAEAAAQREALRLPPPQPETPTPPPGVNLAPPGPPGSDWRDEIAVPTDTTGPPGFESAPAVPTEFPPAIVGESALGAGWTGDDPGSFTGPLPLLGDPVVPVAAAPLPADDRYAAEPPADPVTYAGPAAEPFAFDRDPSGSDAFDPFPTLEPETPTWAAGPTDLSRERQDAPTPTMVGDPPFDRYDGPDPAMPQPLFVEAFEPTPFEPAAASAPLVVELDTDPLGSFGLGGGLGGGLADPLPPPPPAAEGNAFDPLPSLEADHGDLALPPPVEPLVPPPPAPLVPPHTRTMAAPPSPRLTPPPPPMRHVAPAVPRSAIRPRTPTRIPAADPAAPKDSDAKAMLARIAALRTHPDNHTD